MIGRGGPDIAIMLAEKGKKGSSSGCDGGDMYYTIAEDMIDAIEKKDAKLLAEILRAYHSEREGYDD